MCHGSLHNTIDFYFSDEDFIEVSVDPGKAVVEDELFPASIFDTCVTDQVSGDKNVPIQVKKEKCAGNFEKSDKKCFPKEQDLSEKLNENKKINVSSRSSYEVSDTSRENLKSKSTMSDILKELQMKKEKLVQSLENEGDFSAELDDNESRIFTTDNTMRKTYDSSSDSEDGQPQIYSGKNNNIKKSDQLHVKNDSLISVNKNVSEINARTCISSSSESEDEQLKLAIAMSMQPSRPTDSLKTCARVESVQNNLHNNLSHEEANTLDQSNDCSSQLKPTGSGIGNKSDVITGGDSSKAEPEAEDLKLAIELSLQESKKSANDPPSPDVIDLNLDLDVDHQPDPKLAEPDLFENVTKDSRSRLPDSSEFDPEKSPSELSRLSDDSTPDDVDLQTPTLHVEKENRDEIKSSEDKDAVKHTASTSTHTNETVTRKQYFQDEDFEDEDQASSSRFDTLKQVKSVV